MAFNNKPSITHSAEFARAEEQISKKKATVLVAVMIALALTGCAEGKNSDNSSAKTSSVAHTKGAETTVSDEKKEITNEMLEHDIQEWENTAVVKVTHKTGKDENHLLTNDEKWLDENENVVISKLYNNSEKKPKLVETCYYAYTYDDNGNILKETEVNNKDNDFGDVTVYQYSSKLNRDGKQRLLKEETYSVGRIGDELYDDASESWEWVYNNAGDNVKCVCCLWGSIYCTWEYSYEYDKKGRATKLEWTKNSGKKICEFARVFEYENDSDKVSKEMIIDPKTGKKTGESNIYKYNKHGDEIERVFITKYGEEGRYTIEYDEQNRVTKKLSYENGKVSYAETYTYKKL